MPAWCASRLVQGTPPSTAKSTLKAPGPYRKRRRRESPCPATDHRGCRRSRRVPDRTSSHRSAATATPFRSAHPVSILPPSSPSTPARALMIDLRTPRRDRPAVPVSGGDDAETNRRGHRIVKRPKCMCRNTTEQCPRTLCAEHPGQRRGGKHRGQPEPGQRRADVWAPAAADP